MQNRLGFHSSHPTLANATLTPGRKSWQTKCWLLEKKDQKFRDIYTFKALKCATFITVISVSCLYDHLNVTHEIPSKQSCCLLCRVPVRQESLLSHKTCGNLLEQNICFWMHWNLAELPAASATSCINFYLRDAMLARVFARATCPSVRLSVWHTPVLCQNEESKRHISSPSGSPTLLGSWCQIASRHTKRPPPPRAGASNKGGCESSAIF